ncbi:MAG: tetratricopeptide repeat protein [Campylobacterota bacterium]
MPYMFILTFAAMLLLTGCLSSPKPTVHEKLSSYQNIKEACQQTPPQTLNTECSEFLKDLEEENSLLSEMQEIKEDEKQEAAYIALADREAVLAQKLQTGKTQLAESCRTQISTIVKNDDINGAAFCLLFEDNNITLDEYKYLKKHAPRFDNNPQYRTFEDQYAQEKIHEGLKAMNKGDKKAALNAFKTASDANSAEAAYLVGIIYEEKQIKKAISWHKKAVTEGIELSKLNLARLYLRIKLPNKAREWYLSAAKENNPLAQYRLFKMDAKSKSPKTRQEALVWLERSANNNYPQAQYIYGLQLLKQKKGAAAQGWLEKANANGISGTNLFLGKLYFEQASYDSAYPLLIKAKEQGEANYLLAKMYENGHSVKKNRVLAYRHYKKAHELAHNNYVSDMKRLQKKLTKKERQAAKYVEKKEAQRVKASVKACGQIPDGKNIAVENRTIHIVGVGVKPLEEANGFIVYGEDEKLYYIVDAEMASSIKAYEHINISAKATGKAIMISSDTGTLQPIYQFHTQKICTKN